MWPAVERTLDPEHRSAIRHAITGGDREPEASDEPNYDGPTIQTKL